MSKSYLPEKGVKYNLSTVIKNHGTSPVLWLHGFMGHSDDFNVMTSQHTAHIVKMPGHEIPWPEASFGFKAMIRAIVAYCKAWDIRKIGGYSMGARIALYAALFSQNHFDTLFLISASTGLQTIEERQARQKQEWQWANNIEADYHEFLNRWYKNPMFAPLTRLPHFNEIFNRRLQHSPEQIIHALHGFSVSRQPWLEPLLKKQQRAKQMHIYYFAGESDTKYKKVASKIEQIPGVESLVLNNCGHSIHLENPEFISEVISNAI